MIGYAFAFMVGASIGSFLNVAADRLPRGQSLLSPPSHCPACGRRLTPLELVPVLSYIALRGRCYRCRSSIPLRIPVVELTAGLLALYLWRASALSPASLVLMLYVSLFLLLAVIDLEHGIIPDALVYPALGLSLLLAPWWQDLGLGREFLGNAGRGQLLLGSLVGGAIGSGFFGLVVAIYPRGMGLGDVKMAGLIGLAGGVPGILVALMVSIVSGGLVAALLLGSGLRRRGQSMPFGPFLALGGVAGLLWGDGLWHWYLGLLG